MTENTGRNISANSQVEASLAIPAVSGYTPFGVASLTTDQSYNGVAVMGYSIEATTIGVSLRNLTSATKSNVKCHAYVMYARSGMARRG